MHHGISSDLPVKVGLRLKSCIVNVLQKIELRLLVFYLHREINKDKHSQPIGLFYDLILQFSRNMAIYKKIQLSQILLSV